MRKMKAIGEEAFSRVFDSLYEWRKRCAEAGGDYEGYLESKDTSPENICKAFCFDSLVALLQQTFIYFST
jgi:hypothetical protein